MNGSSLPGAKNVAQAAKMLQKDTQATADMIVDCFTSTIKYIFDAIKKEDFFKDFNKDIDMFCMNSDKSIKKFMSQMTKILQDNIDKSFANTVVQIQTISSNVTLPIRTIIADVDGIKLPDGVIPKLKKIKRVLKKYKKVLKRLKEVIKALKKLGRFKVITNFLLKTVKKMTDNIAEIYADVKSSALNCIHILFLKKFLLKSVDVIANFIEKVKEMTKGMTLKLVYRVILAKHTVAKVFDVYDLMVQLGKKSIKIVLVGLFLNWGAKILKKFTSRLKEIIDTINKTKISLKTRIKLILLKSSMNDLFFIAGKTALYLLYAIPSWLGALSMWLFVRITREIVKEINKIRITGKTLGRLLGLKFIIGQVTFISAVCAIYLASGLFVVAILGALAMWLFVFVARQVIKEINQLSPTKNTLKKLLQLLAITVLLTFIGLFAVIGGILCAIGCLGVLAMWGMIVLFSKVIEAIKELKINKKIFITLALLLAAAVLITIIVFCMVLATKIGEKISLKGLGLMLLAIGTLIGMVLGLGALMNTGWGLMAMVLGTVAILMILFIAFLVFKISQISEKINIDSLKTFAKALGVILGMVKGLMKNAKITLKTVLDVLILSLVIFIMMIIALAIAVISKISTYISLDAIGTFEKALGIILGTVKLVTDKAKIKMKTILNVLILALLIVVLAAIAIGMAIISKVSEYISIPAIMSFEKSLGIILGTLNTVLKQGKISLKVIKNILLLALVLVFLTAIAISMAIVSKVSEKISVPAIVSFEGALTGILKVLDLVLKVGKINLKTIIQILLISAAIICLTVIAISLALISKVSEKITISSLGNIGLALGIILPLLVGLGIAGVYLMIPLMMAAAVIGTIMISVLSLLVLAKTLTKFDDSQDYSKRVDIMIGLLTSLINGVCSINPFKMFFALGIITTMLLPLAMELSFMTLLLAGIAKLSIADEWNEKGKPIHYRQLKESDFQTAANNVKIVLTTIVDAATSKEVIDCIGIGLIIAMHNLSLLNIICLQLAFMAEVIGNVAKMSIADEWSSEGKPIHFRQLTPTDFANASKSVEDIVLSLCRTVTSIGTEEIERAADRAEDIFDDIEEIIDPIAGIVDIVCRVATLQIPDEWNDEGRPISYKTLSNEDFQAVGTSINTIVLGFCGALETIGTKEMEDAANKAEDIFDDIEDIVDPIAGIVDMTLKLATAPQIPDEWDKDGKPLHWTKITDTDYTNAGASINTIVTKFLDIFTGESFTKLIKDSKDLADDDTKAAFETIAVIIDPIKTMVELVRDTAAMRVPDEWDEKGNPIHYTKIGDTEFTKAQESITKIVNGTFDMFDKLEIPKDKDGKVKGYSQLAEAFNEVKRCMDPINKILNMVTGFASGVIPTHFNSEGKGDKWMSIMELTDASGNLSQKGESIKNTIKNIITLTFDAISESVEGKSLSTDTIQQNAALLKGLAECARPINTMMSYYDKLDDGKLKNVKEFTQNNINWLNKVNDIDVSKVRTTAGMFHEMAEFSKSISGNFDKLADTLNEKLMKVLEELKEILTDASEKIDKHHEEGGNKNEDKGGWLGNDKKTSAVSDSPSKDNKNKEKKTDLSSTNRAIDDVGKKLDTLIDAIKYLK